MLQEQIDTLRSKLKDTDFYRIFYEQSNSETLLVKDGKVDDILTNESEGISIFYVINKFGYFYHTNDFDKLKEFNTIYKDGLPKTIDYELLESGVKDKKIIGKETRYSVDEVAKDFANATKLSDKIVTNYGRYVYANKKRIIICPNTEIEQITNRGFATFFAVAKEGTRIRQDSIRIGLSSALNDKTAGFINSNTEMRKELEKKLTHKEGLVGNYDVILDPDLSDLLAHEAIGHATESDLIGEGFSMLKNKCGKKIAPEFVTLYDDPTVKDELFGSFYYDDEGFPAKNKELIKNGILNEYIMSSKYSSKLNLPNNGGSRCESYKNMPIPRMSNTSFVNGDHNIDEMIKEMKTGVILSKGSGGQVDPNSGVFQFGVREGRIVKSGEIVSEHVNLTFGGNILDALENVAEISKENDKNSPGFCGKDGQSVPVGGFGPYIKIRNIKLG